MLRSLVKSATAYAVSWTRIDEAARVRLHRHLPFVVCYHRVVEHLNALEGFALPAMETSVGMLERQLEWLSRHFRIVSLNELPGKLERSPYSRPMAAVTFDDGYSDVYHHALPLLKRMGIPAGIFVVTDLVGSEQLPVHERLYASLARLWSRCASPPTTLADVLSRTDLGFSRQEWLAKGIQDPFSATRFLLMGFPQAEILRVISYLDLEADAGETFRLALQPMNWEMLVTMRRAGMTIGSHSKTHPFLNNEGEQRIREETWTSRRELERRLGTEVTTFAYPGGSFNSSVVRAVAAAGYRVAFTVCRHQDSQHPLLTIPRKVMSEKSGLDAFGRFSPAIMSCQTAGTFDWTSRCGHSHNGNPKSGLMGALNARRQT